MPTSTSSAVAPSTVGVSPYLQRFLDKKLLTRLLPKLQHVADGYTRSIPGGNGKTISFRRRNRIVPSSGAAYLLTEGVTPGALTPSTDEILVTVGQYGGWIDATDVADAISFDDLMAADIEDLGDFNGEVLDLVVRDAINGGTNVLRPNGRTTRGALLAGDVLDDATLKKASAWLSNKNVPTFADGCWHAIIPALARYDIMGTDGWKYPAQYQDKNQIDMALIEKLYKIKIMDTSLATTYTAGGNGGQDVFGTLVYGPGAFGVVNITKLDQKTIIKAKGSSGSADPLDQRGSRGTKASMGAAVLNQNMLLRIEHSNAYAG